MILNNRLSTFENRQLIIKRFRSSRRRLSLLSQKLKFLRRWYAQVRPRLDLKMLIYRGYKLRSKDLRKKLR